MKRTRATSTSPPRSPRASSSSSASARGDGELRALRDASRASDRFESYYQTQKVCVDDDDFAMMMAAFRRPLPLTFRLNAARLGRLRGTRASVERDVLPNVAREIRWRKIKWIPNDVAYEIAIAHDEVLKTRESAALVALHEFLKRANETGALTRQELVSMIPPLVLDVNEQSAVLDMCAAPGSKTSQLLESVAATSRGVVVANDASLERCNLLTHQCKRLNSPALVVTNHQAQLFPALYDSKGERIRFDRILADVPCSGDGTLRKSADLWHKWSPSSGVDLHTLQLEIATHALRLLDVGGRMVYSTCSLNPLENESVVAALLKRAKGSVELVDVSKSLPELKRRPGMKKWKVGDVFGFHDSYDGEDGVKRQKTLARTMFWEPAYDAFPLERCVRILPHLDDTGGFFITVLKKIKELPEEMEVLPFVDANKAYRMAKDNAEWNDKKRVAGVLKFEDAITVSNIAKHYGLSDSLSLERSLMTRQLSDEPGVTPKRLYYLAKGARKVLTATAKDGSSAGLQVVACGVRVFERQVVKGVKCAYRITQEGLDTVYPHMRKQVVRVRAKELEMVLARQQDEKEARSPVARSKSDEIPVEITHSKSIEKFKATSDGCVILVPEAAGDEETFQTDASALALACWLGNGDKGKSLSVLASKAEGAQLLYQLRDCMSRKTVK